MKKIKVIKPYLSFFKLRLNVGLQYRFATFAGIFTPFAWGFLAIFVYRSFYDSNPESFPMSLHATVTYMWLQEAFLILFAAWFVENEIIDSVSSGNVIYELLRPLFIYPMWFFRNGAYRLSKTIIQCMIILLAASFLPKGFRMGEISDIKNVVWFLVSFMLGFLVTVSLSTLIYVLLFYTISPLGLRIIVAALYDFFSGAIIPLPFFPKQMQWFMSIQPFAAMQNVPFRIYIGSITGNEIYEGIALQIFWFFVLTSLGAALCKKAQKNLMIQGG